MNLAEDNFQKYEEDKKGGNTKTQRYLCWGYALLHPSPLHVEELHCKVMFINQLKALTFLMLRFWAIH